MRRLVSGQCQGTAQRDRIYPYAYGEPRQRTEVGAGTAGTDVPIDRGVPGDHGKRASRAHRELSLESNQRLSSTQPQVGAPGSDYFENSRRTKQIDNTTQSPSCTLAMTDKRGIRIATDCPSRLSHSQRS